MRTPFGKIVIVLALMTLGARADLSLETETARLPLQGAFSLSAAAEYQYARDDQEVAVPLAFEYGLLDRLELLVEPTAYIGIFPRRGAKNVQGVGDTEITLTYLLVDEQRWIPAIAIAGEVKIPSARDKQIGTREFDYAFYLIASKRIGDFDLHANLVYTFVGAPAGARAKDTYQIAVAAEYFINPKWDAFAEVMYTSSSLGSARKGTTGGGEGTAAAAVRPFADTTDGGGIPTGGGTTSAELLGVEVIGTAGLRYHVDAHFDLFGSVSYDNSYATLFRLGFTYRF